MPSTILIDFQTSAPPKNSDVKKTPIWRYMKLSTLFLLFNGKAFFPTVKKLKEMDRLEGEILIHAHHLDTKNDLTTERNHISKFIEWLKTENQTHKDDPDLIDVSDEAIKLFRNELIKRCAAWCWFHCENESHSMWQIYGKRGVAIKSTIGSLHDSLNKIEGKEFQITDVKYIDSETFNNWISDHKKYILRPHLLKSKEYSSEHEIRVVTHWDGNNDGVLVENICWKTLIEEIVISDELPFTEFEVLKKILAEKWGFDKSKITRSKLLGKYAEIEKDQDEVEHGAFAGVPFTEDVLPDCLKQL